MPAKPQPQPIRTNPYLNSGARIRSAGREARVLYTVRSSRYAGRGRAHWFVQGYAVRWLDTGEEGYVPAGSQDR